MQEEAQADNGEGALRQPSLGECFCVHFLGGLLRRGRACGMGVGVSVYSVCVIVVSCKVQYIYDIIPMIKYILLDFVLRLLLYPIS